MASFINKLEGKKVLVVGGSSGIGFATAEASLASGAQVFISSSSSDKVTAAIDRLKRGFKGIGPPAVFGKAIDSKSTAAVKGFMDWVDEEGKGDGLDHLVYTAGDALALKPFLEQEMDDAKKSADVRYWDMLRVIQAAHPLLKGKGRLGSITITSGTVTIKPPSGWAILSGVAGATESVTRGLAVDLAPVRVNCILPGLVLTELWDSLPPDHKDAIMKTAENLLTGKVGMPEDVAEAYLFCMRSAYVTGASIKVDGGGTLI